MKAMLAGGHVPTQNRFMKQLRLRERLQDYTGIIVAWSAGSMNCADNVYAGPELEGEAIDPLYERWITGLGLTDINIFPHFQSLKDDYLDGLRLIEDITFADSMGHEIIALNDGSYIMLEDGNATLYGEAYMIRDGQQWQICQDGATSFIRVADGKIASVDEYWGDDGPAPLWRQDKHIGTTIREI